MRLAGRLRYSYAASLDWMDWRSDPEHGAVIMFADMVGNSAT